MVVCAQSMWQPVILWKIDHRIGFAIHAFRDNLWQQHERSIIMGFIIFVSRSSQTMWQPVTPCDALEMGSTASFCGASDMEPQGNIRDTHCVTTVTLLWHPFLNQEWPLYTHDWSFKTPCAGLNRGFFYAACLCWTTIILQEEIGMILTTLHVSLADSLIRNHHDHNLLFP